MPEVVKLFDKVVLLMYETSADAAKAFVRVQEHYECQDDDFRGKTFTLGEFREWYTDKTGQWSYYKDWQGFNVPCEKFAAFLNGSFDPLMQEEAELIELVRYLDPAFYIIGLGKDADADVLGHEVAHALYATDLKYRENVHRICAEYDADRQGIEDWKGTEALLAKLTAMGYGENVLFDECHAYLAASRDWLREQDGLDVPWELSSRLRSNLLRTLENANLDIPIK